MTRSTRTRALRLAVSLALLGGTAATSVSAAEISSEPGIGIGIPEDVGVDSAPLVRMSEWIRRDRLDVRSLLVIKDGKLIYERYSKDLDRDYNYELYSVTKTVTALNFGILADERKIDLHDEVAPWILKLRPEFGAAMRDKAGLNLLNLMSMSSGLFYQQVEGSDPLYFQAPDRVDVALSAKPRIPPATEFEYTDVNPVLVGAAIQAASGQPEHEFAEARLFRPLGMRNASWTGRDGTGEYCPGR